MLKKYLESTIAEITKNKYFSILNIVGFALAVSISLLIIILTIILFVNILKEPFG